MNTINEAAYLYVQSKKLHEINSDLKKLAKKAHKQKTKHSKATSERKQEKHRKKHASVTKDINGLMREHTKLIKALHHHNVAFAHALKRENKF